MLRCRFWPVREYPWGSCEALSSQHSDLAALKKLLFEVTSAADSAILPGTRLHQISCIALAAFFYLHDFLLCAMFLVFVRCKCSSMSDTFPPCFCSGLRNAQLVMSPTTAECMRYAKQLYLKYGLVSSVTHTSRSTNGCLPYLEKVRA